MQHSPAAFLWCGVQMINSGDLIKWITTLLIKRLHSLPGIAVSVCLTPQKLAHLSDGPAYYMASTITQLDDQPCSLVTPSFTVSSMTCLTFLCRADPTPARLTLGTTKYKTNSLVDCNTTWTSVAVSLPDGGYHIRFMAKQKNTEIAIAQVVLLDGKCGESGTGVFGDGLE